MTHVVDRRSDMGVYRSPSSKMSPTPLTASSASPSSMSRNDHPHFSSRKNTHHALTSPKDKDRWSSITSGNTEESTLSRVQQFIIDTFRNPVNFILSDSQMTVDAPYKAINDPHTISEAKKKNGQLDRASGKAGGQHDQIEDKASSQHNSTLQSVALNGSVAGEAISPKKRLDLFPYKISLHSAKDAAEHGAGLMNRGNTCYMNSTLQALMHLPPLSYALLMLDADQLHGRFGRQASDRFDALQEMAKLANRTMTRRSNSSPAAPVAFIANLKQYARTLVKFRQEDAHEFLRFLLDAMQHSCVARAPKTLKPFDPLRETTIVHKIFGGKLRSRVQCSRCKHNSDTFDPILDLSLDIRNLRSNTLSAALDNFTSVDHLTGSEKYRCENCKKPVNATKQFTIHQAPVVLTIHLKRFTLTGQKISKQIAFGDDLVLQKDVLSEGVPKQRYKLHSVVHHHGSGPNSGHYVASVRGTSGRAWYEMNDSSVYPHRGTPINARDAYILFYVRAPESSLNGIMQSETSSASVTGKRRRLSDEEESSLSDGVRETPKKKAFVNESPFKPRNGTLFRNLDGAKAPLGDDDLGEAVDNAEAKPNYESLISSQSPKRSGKHNSIPRHSSPSNRGMNSMVVSPYLAGGKTSSKNIHRPSVDSVRSRMKNKHGHRFH